MDPLKGLNPASRYVVDMVVEGLAPYFPENVRTEAVQRLKAGLALVAYAEGQTTANRHFMPNVVRGMNTAGKLIAGTLSSMIERAQDPEELLRELSNYSQHLQTITE